MARISEALMRLAFSLAPILVLGINADYDYINVTACPSDRLDAAISKCIWKDGKGDLIRRINAGFPWSPETLDRHSDYPGAIHHLGGISKTRLGRMDRKGSLLDPMDNLDGICKDFDKASSCLGEYQTPEFCLRLGSMVFQPFINFKTFKFICRNQTRDANLLRSLQCLHDTRLPSMLYYHIATECRQGMDILDQQMLARKKTQLYILNSRIPLNSMFKLYCLPERVLSKCVHEFVENHCGKMAADLLVNYINYIQEEEKTTFKLLGQATDLCNRNMSQERHSLSNFNKSYKTKVFQYRSETMLRESRRAAFFAVLSKNYSDTELDTVTGRRAMSVLMGISGPEICSITYLSAAYALCVWQGHDIREIPKFHILQYAHTLQPFYYQGSHCWRIGQFTQCWNSLQNICGSGPTRYFAQHATLMIDGCRLQDKMDDISCHWQDFLLPAYIKASRVTRWPTLALSDPMSLDGIPANPLNCLPDFETLWQAVDKLTVRCGTEAGTYLRRILDKIRYSQYDALAFVGRFKI